MLARCGDSVRQQIHNAMIHEHFNLATRSRVIALDAISHGAVVACSRENL